MSQFHIHNFIILKLQLTLLRRTKIDAINGESSILIVKNNNFTHIRKKDNSCEIKSEIGINQRLMEFFFQIFT